MDSAIKFQNYISDLKLNLFDEYQKIFLINNKGIFISNLTDAKTRKYTLEQRKTNSRLKLSKKRFDEMNSFPFFYLYAIDTISQVCIKMKIEKVYLEKKDIPEEKIQLIPKSIQDFFGYAYYEFSEIINIPYPLTVNIINSNTKKILCDVKQINPNAPWYVEEILNSNLSIYLQKSIKDKKDILENYSNYCVYRYSLKINDNQTMNYIGMTSNLSQRIDHHKNPNSWISKRENTKFLYLAFKNCGYENFNFSILHSDLTEKEAHYLEAQEIKNYNAYYPYGFNVRDESKYLIF